MARNDEEIIHVMMLPWLAFGHMIPFLQLSFALAKSGIRVSFISTPKNIQRLPKIPPNLSKLIDLVPIPLPKLDNGLLPDDAEATVDVPIEKIQYLKTAYDLLQEPVGIFVAEKSPDWMIVDFAPYWVVEIGRELNVPIVRYYAVSAITVVFFGAQQSLAREGEKKLSPKSWTVPPNGVKISSKSAYKKHEADNMNVGFHGKNASGVPDAERVARITQACKAFAIRTCPEYEADYLKLHENNTGKPVFPVGFLLPEKLNEETKSVTKDQPWNDIFQWLDEQKQKSVVFVGFGSEWKLNKEQIHEIAYGIELSGLPFLWALRKPDWDATGNNVETLPPGFVHRTAGRGVVHVGWAPQREILAHPSIGGSLFHAGWGSIIETLQYGHCLVVLPFVIDQPLNARLLVEKGLGIEVERGEDGSFSRNDIASALRKAMVEKEGEEVRKLSKEACDGIFGDEKLHDCYIQKFVEYLRNGI